MALGGRRVHKRKQWRPWVRLPLSLKVGAMGSDLLMVKERADSAGSR